MSGDVRYAICPIVIADAEVIGEMAKELAAYLQSLGERGTFCLTAERVRRDGFGPDPAFKGLIAERAGEALGYLLHHPAYDTDRAERYLIVCDLFVRPVGRCRGIGRALMSAAMDHCRNIGGCGLLWSVCKPNKTAVTFYRNLGATAFDTLDFMWWPAEG